MKRFLISFLGTMAGIWLSILLLFVGFFIVIVAAVASSSSTKNSGSIGKNTVLHLQMSGEITDRPSTPDLQQIITGDDSNSQGLNDITGAILLAARDKNVDGIFIDCAGASAGVASLQAIVTALDQFKAIAPEKWIYAYADSYSQSDYLVASAADSIFLNPIGEVDIHGLASIGMYFKDLMEKVGVQAQVVKVGTYKSAVEPFLLDSISKPAREQQQLYLSNIWSTLTEIIAAGREVTAEDVNSWADDMLISLDQQTYIEKRIVDSLVYRHDMEQILARKVGKKEANLVNIADYCNASNIGKIDRIYSSEPSGKSEATIAVLYATGDITTDGKEGIVSEKLVPEIFDLIDNDDIDGLIMRVNSGGGSAFASEQIWHALEQFKEKTGKPFYVSMADYAASGGYYISCGADKIFAEPTTLTGSIGIFGIMPNAEKLLNDKLGIHTSTVATNPGSVMLTPYKALTPAQYAAMQKYVDRGYELFTSRCAEGRGIEQDSIKKIAEGRVWDGREALRIGLVDELGGLDKAIAAMAEQLNARNTTIEEYPVLKPDFWSILLETGNQLQTRNLRDRLGPLYPAFKAASEALENDPLQCRMDYVIIH
ncbi:MAG: signal peptide peptidase SppA [Lachnoclostridium sp.]|nr:signal peptide peptidase SppA [Lachnoclostridium sp.]